MERTEEPFDYDSDPGRFRVNMEATRRFGFAEDIHTLVAERLAQEGRSPVLDLGCGEGRLTLPLRSLGIPTVAYDLSPTMLAALSGDCVLGDAAQLPFAENAFGAVAALYMLYHLADPGLALAEAQRILAPGGLFVAAAPSRENDPELASVLPQAPETTFDAENGPTLLARYFAQVAIERWDAPLVFLPDRAALTIYLRGRGVDDASIEPASTSVDLPLYLTKRGALMVAHNA